MTYSDLSGLHYRYQSPAQAASKINASVTNATLNIGKPGKYPPLESTQRILQTPKSSGQRLMSGGFSNSGKSRVGREYREQKASSRVSSTKNQQNQQRQTTPFGKSRDMSIGKKTQPSTSIESLMSTDTDQGMQKEGNKSDAESISDSLKQYESDRHKKEKNETGKRSSSVTATNVDTTGNRLQIQIPGGNLVESDLGNGFKSFTTRNAETG